MKTSEIRALFSVVSRPEVVSLAGGMPAVTALPLDAVGSMIGELVSGMGAQTLQYGSGQGDPRLRERICDVMALEGITDASPSEVVVTVGSQQGLDLVTRVFCDPGDVILAEGPSYVGALGVFQAAEARVRHVAMDDARADPRGARGGAGRLPRQRRPGQVPLHRAELPQPGRRDAVRAAPRGDRRPRREARPAGHRGQPVRPARLRARAAARAAGPQQPAGHLPRLVLQDLLPGPAGGLGARAARRPGEAGAGHRGAGALPAVADPVRRRPVPGHPAVARADQDLHRALPRAPRRLPGVAGRAHARRAPPGPGPRAASTCG